MSTLNTNWERNPSSDTDTESGIDENSTSYDFRTSSEPPNKLKIDSETNNQSVKVYTNESTPISTPSSTTSNYINDYTTSEANANSSEITTLPSETVSSDLSYNQNTTENSNLSERLALDIVSGQPSMSSNNTEFESTTTDQPVFIDSMSTEPAASTMPEFDSINITQATNILNITDNGITLTTPQNTQIDPMYSENSENSNITSEKDSTEISQTSTINDILTSVTEQTPSKTTTNISSLSQINDINSSTPSITQTIQTQETTPINSEIYSTTIDATNDKISLSNNMPSESVTNSNTSIVEERSSTRNSTESMVGPVVTEAEPKPEIISNTPEATITDTITPFTDVNRENIEMTEKIDTVVSSLLDNVTTKSNNLSSLGPSEVLFDNITTTTANSLLSQSSVGSSNESLEINENETTSFKIPENEITTIENAIYPQMNTSESETTDFPYLSTSTLLSKLVETNESLMMSTQTPMIVTSTTLNQVTQTPQIENTTYRTSPTIDDYIDIDAEKTKDDKIHAIKIYIKRNVALNLNFTGANSNRPFDEFNL